MGIRLAIWLTVVGASLISGVSPSTYMRMGRDITSYPHDVPSDVERIIIELTSIERVDYIEDFPHLLFYELGSNKVSEFPDLTNVSDTLTELTITRTLIDALPVDLMATMPELVMLNIKNNRITHLPDLTAVFPGLDTLHAEFNDITWMGQSTAVVIHLDCNRMTALPDLSHNSDRLQQLVLRYNNISSLPPDSIPFLPNCTLLDLSHNKLTTFPNLTLLPRLTNVQLESNAIRWLPDVPLPLPPECQNLDLHQNHLSVFPNLGGVTTLTTIKLDYNAIVSVPDGAIPLSPHCTTLALDHNKLETFPDLRNLTALTTVDLSTNAISSFPDGPIPLPPRCTQLNLMSNKLTSFPNLTNAPHLESIVLSSNAIESVPGGSIPLMPNCSRLELRYNKLVAFPDLSNATKLAKVDLFHNLISSLPDGPIPLPPSCQELVLSYNRLTSFPIIGNATSLRSITISNNQISSLPDGAIAELPNCEELILNDNEFGTFPDLSNLTALTKLVLSRNQISSIPDFVNLPSLKYLFLDGNKLTSLQNLARVSSSLENLFIQDNYITGLPDRFVAEITNLRHMEVGKYRLPLQLPNFCLINDTNPPLTLNIHASLYCDEKVFYAKLARNTGRISFITVPWCQSPAHLKGRQFDTLTADDIWRGLSGEIQGSYAKLVASWSCPVAAKNPFRALSKVKCAITCKEQQDCPMFSYANSACVLTNTEGATDMVAFHQHTDWYVMSG